MDISIIIVNYNTGKITVDCINSVIKYSKNIDYEIIVIDNNSCDSSKNDLKKINDDRVKIILNNDNLGFGLANNQGAKYATGKYLLFLNSDTLFLNNSLKYFKSYYEKSDEKLGIIGSNLLDKNALLVRSYDNFPNINFYIEKYLKKIFVNYYKCIFRKMSKLKFNLNVKAYEGNTDFVCGANLFIRKDLFIHIGGFNKVFFLNFEETELQYRLKKSGYIQKVINGPKIIHLEGSSQLNYIINKNIYNLKQIYFDESMLKYFAITNKRKKIKRSILFFLLLIDYLNPFYLYRNIFKYKIYKHFKIYLNGIKNEE